MLDYMDRIAELSERYNAEWQAKAVELSGSSVSEVNAALAKFKTEFKSKPENKLIQTPEDQKYLESIADKETYSKVNSNYLNIQREANKEAEEDSFSNLKRDILVEMADSETTPERRTTLQGILDEME